MQNKANRPAYGWKYEARNPKSEMKKFVKQSQSTSWKPVVLSEAEGSIMNGFFVKQSQFTPKGVDECALKAQEGDAIERQRLKGIEPS